MIMEWEGQSIKVEEEEGESDLPLPLHLTEEDVEEFAIIPPPQDCNDGNRSSSLFCLICGDGSIPWRKNMERRKGEVGDYLCQLLGVSCSSYSTYFAAGSYCKSCQDYVGKIMRTLKKLEEIEREVEGMKEEVKKRIVTVEENGEGADDIKKKLVQDFGDMTKRSIAPSHSYGSESPNLLDSEEIKQEEEQFEFEADEDPLTFDLDQVGAESLDLELSLSSDNRYSLRKRTKAVYSAPRPTRIAKSNPKVHQPTWPCPICGKRCKSEVSLDAHTSKHKGIKNPWACSYPGCSKKFRHSCDLRTHQEVHEGKFPFPCTICEKSFTRLEGLRRHEATFHIEGGKKHVCQQCGHRSVTNCDLQRHMSIHTGTWPYSCDQCGKGFTHRVTLEDHIHVVHANSRYQCPFPDCDKSFRSRSNLAQHEKVHKNLVYQCEICGLRMVSKRGLKNHSLTHLPEEQRSLKCQFCGKGFNRNCYLQLHLRKHQGTHTHFCSECGKGFFNSRVMRRHHESIHVRGGKPRNRKRSEKWTRTPVSSTSTSTAVSISPPE